MAKTSTLLPFTIGGRMTNTMVFLLWVVLVMVWNYGFPEATPFQDVIAAIFLSFFPTVVRRFKNIGDPHTSNV